LRADPIMAHQIDLFCVPQLADTGRLEADHKADLALAYEANGYASW
jgi:hypothetical protein